MLVREKHKFCKEGRDSRWERSWARMCSPEKPRSGLLHAAEWGMERGPTAFCTRVSQPRAANSRGQVDHNLPSKVPLLDHNMSSKKGLTVTFQHQQLKDGCTYKGNMGWAPIVFTIVIIPKVYWALHTYQAVSPFYKWGNTVWRGHLLFQGHTAGQRWSWT